MNMKHTPGPWFADIGRCYGHPAAYTPNIPINPVVLGRPINISIAKIPRSGLEAEANARLMAASPSLLAALEMMVESSIEPPAPDCRCHLSPPCNDCVENLGLREAFEYARAAMAQATGDAS